MAPAPISCIELHRLKDAYQQAQYLLLLEAVLRYTGIDFSEKIQATRTAMLSIKYAILEHQDKHGCA